MGSEFDYPFSFTMPASKFSTPYVFTSTNSCNTGSVSWKLANIGYTNSIILYTNYLELTRKETTEKVAIVINVNFKDWNRHWSGTMVEGESRVVIPIPYISVVGTLVGTVSIIHLSNSNFPSQEIENLKKLPLQLSDDFLCLLNNPEFFPDATLKCGSDKILVHKGVLSKRSPIFAAMFKNEMQEGSGNIVDIVDIEPNVLQATLRYVYSGKTDQVTNGTAGDILFVADKYQLEELKSICISKLKSSITVDNVCRILVLGELHDESLKTHAKEFVSKYGSFSKVENTKEWKLLQTERPGLAMEVLCFVVKYLEEFQKN